MNLDQDCLVLWPEVGDLYHDSNKGGLVAYLLYPGLGRPERAQVDVAPHLSLPHAAKVLNFALQRQLWAPPHQMEAPTAAFVEESPERTWSRELRAVLYLGSVDKSLVHTATGKHLQVCRNDLTQTGDAIAHSLDMEYRLRGTIVTFLTPKPSHPLRLLSWLVRPLWPS